MDRISTMTGYSAARMGYLFIISIGLPPSAIAEPPGFKIDSNTLKERRKMYLLLLSDCSNGRESNCKQVGPFFFGIYIFDTQRIMSTKL